MHDTYNSNTSIENINSGAFKVEILYVFNISTYKKSVIFIFPKLIESVNTFNYFSYLISVIEL